MSDAPVLSARGITVTFGRQRVLDAVDFEVRRGEVHVLAGGNGAGKSTLIRVLSGAVVPDAGEIRLDGAPVRFFGPADALAAGIAVVHQELMLVPSRTVADNLFLGRERCRGLVVDDRAQRDESARILASLDLCVDPSTPVEDLPLGVRQLVEIARALAGAARVLVLDEPTSALDARESERLFDRIAELKRRGAGIVYITHRMDEIDRLADRVTVLRDGKNAVTGPAADVPRERILRAMLGHDPEPTAARTSGIAVGPGNDPPLLALDGFGTTAGAGGAPPLDGISLAVLPGAIVGVGGVQGSGASSLLRALFDAGAAGRTRGTVTIDGKPYVPRDPRRALDAGLALLTNDRQGDGLLLDLDVVENATLAALPRFSPRGIVARAAARAAVTERCAELRVKSASLEQPVRQLSGGNQQKVYLARQLMKDPRVLLLDDPTRGVDVAARADLHDRLRAFAASGRGILFTSTDLDELVLLAHEVVVLHRGAVAARLSGTAIRRDAILAAAFGAGEAA